MSLSRSRAPSWSIRVPDVEAAEQLLARGPQLEALLAADSAPPGAIAPVQAALRRALEPLAAPPAVVERLYFGAEFCERLLPERGAIEAMLDCATRHRLGLTFLSPPVTDAGLDRLAPLLELLASAAPAATEVVASDWGVLRHLHAHHPRLRPVLGRLLTPSLRDPRIAHRLARCPDVPPAALAALCSSSLANPDFCALLAELGVERYELDNLIQGFGSQPGGGAPGDAAGAPPRATLRASLHLPYGVVATGRQCFIGSFDAARELAFSLAACAQRCRVVRIDRGTLAESGGTGLCESGNSLFYSQAARGMAAGLEAAAARGFDRCVLTLGSPDGVRAVANGCGPPRRLGWPRASHAPVDAAAAATPGAAAARSARPSPAAARSARPSPAVPRIVAPLGEAGEVEMLAGAGADELYTGLTPADWQQQFSTAVWANRRGPGGGNLQSEAELELAVARARRHGRPLALALNAPHHAGERLRAALGMARRAAALGVDALIVADPGLLVALARERLPLALHLSSVAALHNRSAAEFFAGLGVRRIILPRHVRLDEIERLAAALPGVELEAFVMNDQCVYEEGHCFTQHYLGGLPVLCHDPAPLRPVQALDGRDLAGAAAADWQRHDAVRRAWLAACAECGGRSGAGGVPLSACGLCALPGLAAAGVSAVKIVGREASALRKLRSVQMVRRLLDGMRDGAGAARSAELARTLRATPARCARGLDCYYRESVPEGPQVVSSPLPNG